MRSASGRLVTPELGPQGCGEASQFAGLRGTQLTTPFLDVDSGPERRELSARRGIVTVTIVCEEFPNLCQRCPQHRRDVRWQPEALDRLCQLPGELIRGNSFE
jgi:hypothetical protein